MPSLLCGLDIPQRAAFAHPQSLTHSVPPPPSRASEEECNITCRYFYLPQKPTSVMLVTSPSFMKSNKSAKHFLSQSHHTATILDTQNWLSLVLSFPASCFGYEEHISLHGRRENLIGRIPQKMKAAQTHLADAFVSHRGRQLLGCENKWNKSHVLLN